MTAAAIATLVLTALLVAALAAYLIGIAWTLRAVDGALGRVTTGMRAVAQRTEAVNPTVEDINGQLQAVAEALEGLVGEPGDPPRSSGRLSPAGRRTP